MMGFCLQSESTDNLFVKSNGQKSVGQKKSRGVTVSPRPEFSTNRKKGVVFFSFSSAHWTDEIHH